VSKNSEKVGDLFEGLVRDIASDGRGVLSHPSGRTIFVSGVWLGERVQVRLTQIKGRVGFAECTEVLLASEHRIPAPCPHHGHTPGRCGACPWQMIAYEEQLRVKWQRVASSFARLGVKEIAPIWPSPKIMGFRNRAQLKTNGQSIGYVSAQSHQLAPIDDCLILSEHNRNTLKTLIQRLPNDEWRPKKKQPWVTLDIDEHTAADQVSVNRRLTFMQANSEQNTKMRDWLAQRLAKLANASTVLEFFAGSGNLTQVIAEQGFAKIIAVEGNDDATRAIKELALPGVDVLAADLFNEAGLNNVLSIAADAEVLVLDPPRDGLKIKGQVFSKRSKITHVFYISCDLATLVRDVEEFQQHKFKIKEVQALDQFPHTPHIEVMVHLQR